MSAINRIFACLWARGGAVMGRPRPLASSVCQERRSNPPACSLTIRWLVTHESTKSPRAVRGEQDSGLVTPGSVGSGLVEFTHTRVITGRRKPAGDRARVSGTLH